MKSGELSIVAGVYLLTLGYMMNGTEWIVAGGAILIFGVVLMCSEIFPFKVRVKGEERSPRMITMPLPSEPRPRSKLPPPDPRLKSYDERSWRYPKDSTGARKHKPKGSEEDAY